MTLYVYHEDKTVGTITNNEGKFSFHYSDEWVKNGFPLCIPMSFQLNADIISKAAFTYFKNILPEERVLANLSSSARIDPDDIFSMLKAYGKDCPGSVYISEKPKPSEAEKYRKVIDITRNVEDYYKTSYHGQPRSLGLHIAKNFHASLLPGAQDKFTCCVEKNSFYTPSPDSGILPTHIVKPTWAYAINEYFCMSLADASSLPVAKVSLTPIEHSNKETPNSHALCIERYDRFAGKRLHQEDLCQALEKSDRQKYSDTLNGISYKEIGCLCNDYLSEEDAEKIVALTAFNMGIGNGDAHGKNISILHHIDGSMSIAPFYDIVCTEVEGFDKNFAIHFGEASAMNEIDGKVFQQFADDMCLPMEKVVSIFETTLFEIKKNIQSHLENAISNFPEYENYFSSIAEKIEENSSVMLELVDEANEYLKNTQAMQM